MLRAGVGQLRVVAERVSNLQRASKLIDEAAHRGCKFFALPEAFTGTYGVHHFRGNAEHLLSPGSGSALMAEAAAKHGMWVCGGVVEEAELGSGKAGTLFNTICAYGPDGSEVARYRKGHLSQVRVGPDATREVDVFLPGQELVSFDIDAGDGEQYRVGLACCFDLRFQEMAQALASPQKPSSGTSSIRSGHACDMLVYSSAWLHSTGALGHWDLMLRARALDNQVWVLGPNHARDESNETVMHGDSKITSPWGQVLSGCENDEADGCVVADLRKEDLSDLRDRIPLLSCRQPGLYL